MQQNGKMIIIGLIGLILVGIGIADRVMTPTDMMYSNSGSLMEGESSTINFYFFIGIPLLILSVVALLRANKRIK
jgi:hypothetical protein